MMWFGKKEGGEVRLEILRTPENQTGVEGLELEWRSEAGSLMKGKERKK